MTIHINPVSRLHLDSTIHDNVAQRFRKVRICMFVCCDFCYSTNQFYSFSQWWSGLLLVYVFSANHLHGTYASQLRPTSHLPAILSWPMLAMVTFTWPPSNLDLAMMTFMWPWYDFLGQLFLSLVLMVLWLSVMNIINRFYYWWL